MARRRGGGAVAAAAAAAAHEMSDDLPAHARKVSSWCFGWLMYAVKYENGPSDPTRSRASA